ncbi:hypothetical protein ACFLZZ_03635 [Nanoarchaeota archaeon]
MNKRGIMGLGLGATLWYGSAIAFAIILGVAMGQATIEVERLDKELDRADLLIDRYGEILKVVTENEVKLGSVESSTMKKATDMVINLKYMKTQSSKELSSEEVKSLNDQLKEILDSTTIRELEARALLQKTLPTLATR